MVKSKKFLLQVLIPLILLIIICLFEYLYAGSNRFDNSLSALIQSIAITLLKLGLIIFPVYKILGLSLSIDITEKIFHRIDGRWFIIGGLIAYSLVLIFSQLEFGDYKYLMRFMGVPAHIRNNFNDLRVITTALDCVGLGKDPLSEGNCKPLFIYNYPRIWYSLHYLGIGEKQTIPFAILMIGVFLSSIYLFLHKLDIVTGLFWTLFIVSPPVMTAIERCNNDVLIFILLAGSLYLINKKLKSFWGYLLIVLSSLLKLYPVFSLPVIFREHKYNRIISALIIVIPLALYSILFTSELMLVNQRSPRPFGNYSFGAFTWGDTLNYYYSYSMLDSQVAWPVFYLIIAMIVLFALYKSIHFHGEISDILNKDAFRIGAGIFTGCFILGNNYDYRLIFLLFCLPQIFDWLKEGNGNRKFTILALGAIILLLQYNFIVKHFFPGIQEFTAKALLTWIIFVYLVFMLINTLPKPVKQLR